jgi:hypothetical protein
MRRWYQAMMVPELATQATFARALLPSCFPISASVRRAGSRQAQACWQARPQNSVSTQILVLEEQFMVHQSRDIQYETSPLIAFHGNCPSSQISDSQDVQVF